MTYRALYREWRPQSFADVVGQEHVVTTLKSALRLDRLAHAYLLSGPRGTGKTTLAKLLAKAVNCEARVDGCEPCNQCPTCLGIMAGSIMDVTEMDAASNRGVDEIRSILEQVQYPPADVRVKAYIIDEVHMLTPEAFNALLKTLEEPPSYCLFVLATTELHKVPATIVSRCQRFELGRVAPELVVARLRHVVDHLAVDVEEAALWQIARVTDGGLRDALSLLDQVLAFAADVVTVDEVSVVLGGVPSERLGQVFGALLRGEAARLFDLLGPVWAQGTDPAQLLTELIAYGRDGLLLKTGAKGLGAEQRARYDPTFALVVRDATTDVLLAILERLAQVQSEMRYQTQGQLVVEMALFSCLGLGKASVPAASIAAPAIVSAPVAGSAAAVAQSTEAALRDELARLTARVSQLEAASRAVRAPQVADAPPVQPPAARIAQGALPESVAPVALVAPVAKVPPSAEPVVAPTAEPSPEPVAGQGDLGDDAAAGALLKRIEQQWTELLDEIRRRSVQTRAWLSAGRPGAVEGSTLWVLFKSVLHAETIMKSPHLELVQELLATKFGHTLKVRAVTEEHWKSERAAKVARVEPDAKPVVQHEPWVENVIEWFGKDRVTITED